MSIENSLSSFDGGQLNLFLNLAATKELGDETLFPDDNEDDEQIDYKGATEAITIMNNFAARFEDEVAVVDYEGAEDDYGFDIEPLRTYSDEYAKGLAAGVRIAVGTLVYLMLEEGSIGEDDAQE